MTGVAIVAAALVAMEGVSYLTHRFVMHGFGIGLHRSHHDTGEGGFELNDLYPLMFSSVAIAIFAVGTLASARSLVLVGVGITLYGVSYLFVHEIYIHRRLDLVRRRWRVLEWLKASHRVHHLFGGEPYGMLLPLVPKELRRRAEQATWDPFEERPRRRARAAA
ncbi:MAG: sterol desaturase family protein [Actinomycetota bacterium]|jgi:beta-carotene 3-hydroxylase|nr:sterol desaturase family protein [Actinomycetota bacterium]